VMKPLGDWWQNDGMEKVLQKYESTLRWSLDHGKSIIGISIAVLFSSFVIFVIFNPGVEFFPEDVQLSQAYLQIEATVGTNVEFTESVVDRIEQKIPQIPNNGDIESVLSTAGTAISAGFGGRGNTSHQGTIVLNFVDYQERTGSTFDAI